MRPVIILVNCTDILKTAACVVNNIGRPNDKVSSGTVPIIDSSRSDIDCNSCVAPALPIRPVDSDVDGNIFRGSF